MPLVGHAWGHCGVAVEAPAGGWLLHAGDAHFHRGEMDPSGHHCTPGLRFYQLRMEVSRRLRLHNQRRLRQLVKTHADDVRVFSAHDPVEFDRLAALSPEETGRLEGSRPTRILRSGWIRRAGLL